MVDEADIECMVMRAKKYLKKENNKKNKIEKNIKN
jgi:hypothetical protein